MEELKKLDEKISSSLGFMLRLDEKIDQIKFGIMLGLVIVGVVFGFLTSDFL